MNQEATQLIQAYLVALAAADLDKLFSLFSKDAVVYSPRYGKQAARDFFPRLFEDTASSGLELNNVFLSENGQICAYFHYDWILKSGESISFDVCDIFTLNLENKISELRIIYSL